MAPSVRTCAGCGTANPQANTFCIECGAPLTDAAPDPGLARPAQTQFTLPDYLLAARHREAEDQRRRLAVREGSGGGLVWTGAPLIGGALLFSSGTGPGATALGLGLLCVVAGFFRMRRDRHAMARAGVATTAVGAVALGAVALQILDLGGAAPLPSATAVARAPTPTPDPAEIATVPGGSGGDRGVAMFLGDPARSGRHPGPAPSGRPTVRWRVHTGGEVYTSPVVVGNAVFVGTKSGFLTALDVATGAERWRVDLGGYVVRATPAVAGGTVYVGAGYALFAVDAATGRERWRLPIRFAGSPSPTVSDGVVYAGTQEGHLYAVDAATGIERWHVEVEGLVFGSPAVAGGTVFVGGDAGALHAFDAATGRLRWRRPVGGEITASPAVANGSVYVASTAPSLVALDAATGDERWRVAIGGGTPPALLGDTLFLGSDDNGLYAVDTAGGGLRLLFPTGGPVVAPPSVAGDALFVAAGSTLHAVGTDGTPRWSYPTGGEIGSAPAVVGGSVYVGSHDGYLYAIGGDRDGVPAA